VSRPFDYAQGVLCKGGHDAANIIRSNRLVLSPSGKTIHCWQSGTPPFATCAKDGAPTVVVAPAA